jgi:hypothetical protein
VHGYRTAFWWAAGIFVVGFLVALFVLPAVRVTPVLAGEPAMAIE